MTRKLTYEEVRDRFMEKGYQLKSSTYKRNAVGMSVICPEGHEIIKTLKSLKQGNGCSECKKFSYEKVRDLFTERGYQVLSLTYEGRTVGLEVICPEGHRIFKTLQSLNHGYGCPECHSLKFSYEEVKQIIESRNYKLLSDTYKNCMIKLHLSCPRGHDWHVSYNSFSKGTDCPCYTEQKMMQTCRRNYGVDYPFQSSIIRQQMVLTVLLKYGYEYASQHPDIHMKQINSSFKKKLYTFPSGNHTYVQGYEPFCLDMLLEEGMPESDIIAGTMTPENGKTIPHISYTREDGKPGVYFPDIFIPSCNALIEVKSQWTFNLQKERNILKLEASVKAGYRVYLCIFGPGGNLIERKPYHNW